MTRKQFKDHLLSFAVAAVLITAWYLATTWAKSHYLKPTPLEVIIDLHDNAGRYLKEAGTTCGEAAIGFVVGNLVAFAVSLWIASSKSTERVIYPYAIAIKATPIIAWAPIMVVVFGLGPAMKIATAALVCFFPLIVQLPDALQRVPRELIEALQILGASKRQILTTLKLRLALPDIFSALKTATSLSLVGAIVGEFISPGAGLGKLMVEATGHGNGAELVSAALAATVAGILFFYFVRLVQHLVITWDAEVI